MPSLFEPQTATAIITRINQLQPTTQRKWGKMTVSQMLFHCTEALGTATGDVVIKPPFILKLLAPIIKKKVLENKPYKEGLPTAKEFITKDDKNFSEEQAKVIERIHQFIANGEAKVEGLKHPAFGKMTAYEWGFSQWKHFDHHLNQFGV